MNKEKILQRLCNDEDYYGDFGNQYLSNSHVGKLLKDPLNAFKPSKPSPAFLIGGYQHILDELQPFFNKYPDVVLDGELYNHDLKDNFEKIISLVRKQKPYLRNYKLNTKTNG